MNAPFRFGLYISAFQLFSVSVFPQGALTPPGPPAPTMKTLTQVQPRVDVATLPSDSSNVYVISQPGSYYLTGNITGSTIKNGISIQTSDVSIDLNGFELIGAGGGSVSAIVVSGSQTNIRICNGIIANWGGNGVSANTAVNSQFERLRVSNCVTYGVSAGNNCSVTACSATGCNTGFSIADGCKINGCTANGNTSSGISGFPGDNCLIIDCVADHNGFFGFIGGICTVSHCLAAGNETGFFFFGSITDSTATGNTSVGILAEQGTTVLGCNATGNTTYGLQLTGGNVVKDCSVSGTTSGPGITAGDSCLISNCVIQGNVGGGITAANHAYIFNNELTGNGQGSGSGPAIHITGDYGRIEGNNANHNNWDGITLDDGTNGTHNTMNNFVIKNVARANGGFNYRIAGLTINGLTGTNEVAPLQVPMNATNPEANSQ